MNANKARLSKSILEMKFMKRTKEKVEKQQFQEEGEEYFGSEMTERMKNYSERFIIEPSYVFCEKLTDGRVSYKGMNPEIERLMEQEQANERVKLEKKNETDISDEQMAQQLDRFKGMRKNAQSKYRYQRSDQKNKEEEPVTKKPRFLKPQD